MGNSINRTNFKLNKLTILDGLEGSDKILISDSNGVSNWRTPTDFISDKPNSHYIGEFFGGGVVVAIWYENGIERCLIAALENITTTRTQGGVTSFIYGFAWSDLNLTSGASYKSFGASNSSLIAAQSATSSAQLCLDYFNPDLGTGVWDDWYLPSIYELNYLINNAAIFNKVLDSYSYDNNEPKLDVVNITVLPTFPNYTYTTDSIFPSNINLLTFGKTKYTKNETTDAGPGGTYTDTGLVSSNDSDYYWSSTEDTSTTAWGVLTGTSSFRNLDIASIFKTDLAKVRPFRIADDTQISFDFEADYIVLTYEFSGERDLDTRTTIITPDLPASESGWGAYSDGIGWTPDAPTHPNSSTYSVIWHGGDNTGVGYESVLINLNAFRFYYPGQSEIIIDAKAHWYVGNWIPDFVPGDQTRLDNTPAVILSVDLYKGGSPAKVGYQWVNPTAGASMSLNSFGSVINTQTYAGVGVGQRVAKFKYNIIGKFGYLFSID
jgi:hypothetical protein